MAVAAGDGVAELQGRNWLIVDLIDGGERELAEAEIAVYGELAERLRIPAHMWYPYAWRAAFADLDGDDAERRRDPGRAGGVPRPRRRPEHRRWCCASQAGDPSTAARSATSYDEDELAYVRIVGGAAARHEGVEQRPRADRGDSRRPRAPSSIWPMPGMPGDARATSTGRA